MDAYERSSAIEHATLTRIADMYNGALRKALKTKRAFLRTVKAVDEGRIKPPDYYVITDQVPRWRQGFLRELIRQNEVIDGIMAELNKAGVDAAKLIQSSMADIYAANRDEALEGIKIAVGDAQVRSSFAVYNKRQISVLVQEGESPFSRLAYENLGQNPAIRRKLQHELGEATILGESQEAIIKRIRRITGQTYNQAKRVAQTERTRVQSQARYEVAEEAHALGVPIEYTWTARMVNTRDSHADLNGQTIAHGEVFRTIWGNELRYPGDPSAPAREVINCHCVLVPDVAGT